MIETSEGTPPVELATYHTHEPAGIVASLNVVVELPAAVFILRAVDNRVFGVPEFLVVA